MAILSGLAMAVIVALNGMNIDQSIANATPPNGAKRDYFYISALSTDAVDGWTEAIVWARSTYDQTRSGPRVNEAHRRDLADAKMLLHLISEERDRLDQIYNDRNTWQEFNYGDFRAYHFLQQHHSLFYDTVNCLKREIVDLQLEKDIDLYDEEHRRMFEYKYPFIDILYSYYPTQLSSYKYDLENNSGYYHEFGDGHSGSCFIVEPSRS